MTELIVLATEDGSIVGSAPKLASHHADTPLHFAFSCFVFNTAGEFLLTRRAQTKKVWPGFWTTSVCGHPAPGESYPDAIARRLTYELGITQVEQLACIDDAYRYKTPPYKGVVENELCPIYIVRSLQDPEPNPLEVGDWRWVDWSTIKQQLDTQPDDYSYWFKDQFSIVNASPLLAQYVGSHHA